MTQASAPTFTPDCPASAARVLCVQDGARLHYALPLAMQEAGILQAMCTDWFVTPGSAQDWISRFLKMLHPRLAAKLRSRSHASIDPRCVRTNTLLMLRQEWTKRRLSGQAYYEWSAAGTGKWIAEKQLKNCNILHGYIRNLDPRLCRIAQQRGLKTIGDQIIAPAVEELAQLRIARDRFPDWEPHNTPDALTRCIEIEQQTWQALDHFTCASNYVREHLIAQGVGADRITVLPYPIDAQHFHPAPKTISFDAQKPVTIGFVGGVNLRKGAPYFFQIARQFDPRRVRFVMVGPVQLDEKIARENRGNVELIGAVPRAQVVQWLSQFDVYLFPSTCEGSAGSVMEAMAMGLPVVTTPNSGSLVRDGIEGYLAAYDDIDLLTARIEALVSDAQLRRSMGQAARLRAQQHDVHWYSGQLTQLCTKMLK